MKDKSLSVNVHGTVYAICKTNTVNKYEKQITVTQCAGQIIFNQYARQSLSINMQDKSLSLNVHGTVRYRIRYRYAICKKNTVNKF